MRLSPGALSISILAFVFMTACATNDPVDPFNAPKRIWPDAPQTPRIAYLGEFSEAADLGIEGGFWSRIVTFTAGPTNNAMARPMAVAASDDGQLIFVADPGSHCVHRFDLRKAKYTRLATAKDVPDAFPVGLALADDGWLYVTDSQRGLLYEVPPGARQLANFDTALRFRQPTGIAWDRETNYLLVTDTKEQVIAVLDRAGELQRSIGGRGSGSGRFNYPTYLWSAGNSELLVTDSLNFRVQRFDSDGAFIQQFGQSGAALGYFSRPKGVAVDSFGNVYVVDAMKHGMQIFNRQGELMLFVGAQGQGAGEFWLPGGIYITEGNTIYVADAYNKRVQVFRYIGPEE
jgi:DNA-binding beta-propeller fold protein YncE